MKVNKAQALLIRLGLMFLLMWSPAAAVFRGSGHDTRPCNSTHGCGDHGYCFTPMPSNASHSICECDKGWKSTEAPCDYQAKNWLVAFLLSFFLGEFGADWFYLANGSGTYIAIGVVKLFLNWFTFGIWWLVDWIRILAGSFLDGNGHELDNGLTIQIDF